MIPSRGSRRARRGHSPRHLPDASGSRRHAEAKPFSIGFRIEHPQSLIDGSRWGDSAGHELWEPRTTSWSSLQKRPLGLQLLHVPGRNGRGRHLRGRACGDQRHEPIFRKERNANAGIVVGITPEQDYPGDALAGIDFQRHWEVAAFKAGRKLQGPTQKVGDFWRESLHFIGLGPPSYTPGVKLTDLAHASPTTRLKRSGKPFRLSIERSRGTP